MSCRGSRWRGLAARRRSLASPAEAGFLLPLALLVALVLLLGSLMLVTLALQARVQASVQRQRRQAEDRLMSAAQQLAGRLQRHCPELLAQPLAAWSGSPCSELVVADAAELVAYEPGTGSGELLLALRDGEAPHAVQQGAYALHWRQDLAAPAPEGEHLEAAPVEATVSLPRLVGLEERGLRAAPAGAGAAQEAG